MADRLTTKDIWNDNDGERLEKKQRKPWKRWPLLLLLLLLVLGTVLVAAYRDGTGFDVLRRFFSYGTAESAGGEAVYHYDAAPDSRFALIGDSLVVLSDSSLKVLDRSSEELWSANVKMTSPALEQSGAWAVAYDVGGSGQLYLLNEKGGAASLEPLPEEPILAATVNEAGYVAVTSEKKNYKGCVTVYDENLEKVFAFNSSRRFVLDAYVSDDCKLLAAVTLGQEDGVFVSNVILYDLGKTDPVADYDVQDGLVLAIDQMGSSFATVSDTSLSFASLKGELLGSCRYGGEFLREYSLEGDGFAALLLNRYRSGSVGRLVTVGPDGQVIASLPVKEEVQAISGKGRYLAVLYLDELVIYNQDLQVYASLDGIQGARDVLLRPDGSALLLSSEKAKLFLP